MTDISDSCDLNQRNRKSWSQHQDSVLTRLVKKYGVKRWTDISKAMSELFDLTNKTGKQCRERQFFFYQRWVNHLDPKINREKWSIQEERKIFDSHKIHGNKWKIIAKQLDNRTDNSIKNHFYSILRKGLRRLNKLIGDRKSTQKVKQIRTSVLSKLYKLESSSQKIQKSVNIQDIYELLFQFSSMSSSNVSQKNLTENIKNDFKSMISHLQEISSQQKINKEKNVAINKSKRQRKNSLNEMMEDEDDQSQMRNEMEENQEQQEEINHIEDKCFPNLVLNSDLNHSGFFINIDIQEKPKELSEKSMKQQKASQKAVSQSFLFSHSQSQPKPLSPDQKQDHQEQIHDNSLDFNLFPSITINIEEQSLSIAHSNDFTFNNCFNKSPLFSSSRFRDHFNLRTPRIPSPGAFNICGVISTAQSYGNGSGFGSKDGNEDKSFSFNNEYDNIVEQLRSNIDANCNVGPITQLRVSSSRNSLIEPCLKSSSSSIYLTPRSGEGKAH